jgi:DNA primase
MLPYKPWIKEGISWNTQMEWEIGFDWESHRIITLIRNINGGLIGVKGRAMDDDNPWKYLYVEQMNKSIELFGLHKTLPFILESKEIILFEGYKSVFKAWQNGCKNCASIEGDDISPAQIALIKSFGLDIKVVLCYDKDKSEEEIKEQAKKITNRKVFYVYDNENLLKGKDSPVDRGMKIWKKLYDEKILYTP